MTHAIRSMVANGGRWYASKKAMRRAKRRIRRYGWQPNVKGPYSGFK